MKFSFIETDLKLAFAATYFINTAKVKLGAPVYNPKIEKEILANTENNAEKLELDSESLKLFVSLYCQVSKNIQNYLRSINDKQEYDLSEIELAFFKKIKEEIPALASIETLADLDKHLKSDNGKIIANDILAFGRSVINSVNSAIFNGIKDAVA